MSDMYKQAIVVRTDLKWGKGKLAAHVAHASLGAALISSTDVVKEWNAEGSKKIVLKAGSEKELKDLERLAKKEEIPAFLARDAGKTQLESGTVTALAIGPAREFDIDRITGSLKLL
jgi:PTH2 family peptidyl-tRNA hydrolase